MLGLAEGVEDEANTAVEAVKDVADEISDVDFDVGGKPSGTRRVDYNGITTEARKALDSKIYDDVIARATLLVKHTVAEQSIEFAGGTPNTTYLFDNIAEEVCKAVYILEEMAEKLNVPITIDNKLMIDGRTFARVATPYISTQLGWDSL